MEILVERRIQGAIGCFLRRGLVIGDSIASETLSIRGVMAPKWCLSQ